MNANTTKKLDTKVLLSTLLMKAIVFNQYGTPDVLKLANVPAPTSKDDQVLIRVFAASVNSADYRLLSGPIPRLMGFGLLRPKDKIMGADIAGRIEAVGENVTRFKPGDEVFGDISTGFGGFAEYVCTRESVLVEKPANLTFEQAAAVPMAAVTALQGLRKGGVQPGNRVAIVGASGGVGTFMVQIAKSFGAEVTGVCSTANLSLVESLGADHVIDYTREDYSARGPMYEAILDAVGKSQRSQYTRALTPNGTFATVAKLATKQSLEELTFVKELIEAGKLRAVLDRCYPLVGVVEAHRYVDMGHKAGNVVIAVR